MTPWTVTHQALLSMGVSRQEDRSGLPFPPPGDLPGPAVEPVSPASQAGSVPTEPAGKPLVPRRYLEQEEEHRSFRVPPADPGADGFHR